MKFCIILTVIFFFTSCSDSTHDSGLEKVTEQDWQVSKLLKQTHTYNKLGLLDTTYQVENIYANGVPAAVSNFIITRKYNNKNNLINEKTFLILKKKNRIMEEKSYDYDQKNNLVLLIEKNEEVLSRKLQIRYNDKSQKTEEIEIQKLFEENPENWNLDSALAHHRDKKNTKYDTILRSYQYNASGNLFKEFSRNSSKEKIETAITLYSDSKKITYYLNFKGDTISMTNYKQKGNSITEVHHDINSILYVDSNRYEGGKLIESISIDKRSGFNRKEVINYNKEGNEIERFFYTYEIIRY